MSSSSYTTTIMSHIKTYEKRSLFISLISRTLIIIVSVTVSLVTAYGVYALFNEGGRFEILQLLSVDAHLLSLYGPEEVIQIVGDIPRGEALFIIGGLVFGFVLAWQLIRMTPLIHRKLASLRRI